MNQWREAKDPFDFGTLSDTWETTPVKGPKRPVARTIDITKDVQARVEDAYTGADLEVRALRGELDQAREQIRGMHKRVDWLKCENTKLKLENSKLQELFKGLSRKYEDAKRRIMQLMASGQARNSSEKSSVPESVLRDYSPLEILGFKNTTEVEHYFRNNGENAVKKLVLRGRLRWHPDMVEKYSGDDRVYQSVLIMFEEKSKLVEDAVNVIASQYRRGSVNGNW